jgi:hypothetical protein
MSHHARRRSGVSSGHNDNPRSELAKEPSDSCDRAAQVDQNTEVAPGARTIESSDGQEDVIDTHLWEDPGFEAAFGTDEIRAYIRTEGHERVGDR